MLILSKYIIFIQMCVIFFLYTSYRHQTSRHFSHIFLVILLKFGTILCCSWCSNPKVILSEWLFTAVSNLALCLLCLRCLWIPFSSCDLILFITSKHPGNYSSHFIFRQIIWVLHRGGFWQENLLSATFEECCFSETVLSSLNVSLGICVLTLQTFWKDFCCWCL